MAWIFSLAGNKGGVGRTAETLGLAYALAVMGYRVAVADMDGQGNATRRLGVDKAALIAAGAPGIADMLHPKSPALASQVAVPCGWVGPAAGNITVLPSLDRASMKERKEDAGRPGSDTRLRRALDRNTWADQFHVVLIDMGPDIDHLADNAFIASDRVILVTDAKRDGIEGAVFVASYVDEMRDVFSREDLAVCAVVVSMFDKDSAKQRAHRDNLPATFAPWGAQLSVWPAAVPLRHSLANAHDSGVPLSTIGHTSAVELLDVYQDHAAMLLEIMKG